jgi:hypothetical protein
MNELETFIGPNGLPTQLFNGSVYQLFPSDPRYFQKGSHQRLHVAVWSFYNKQKPPKGYHVHHKDDNKHNNSPSNLELKKAGEHISHHTQRRIKDDPGWFQDLAKKGQAGAAKWSKTPEGHAFRRKHAEDVLFKYHDHLFKREVFKKCDQCGKEYITTNLSAINARFCSNNCKSQWRRLAGIDNVDKICISCGSGFRSNKYAKRKYCSRKCISNRNPPNL